MSKSYNVKGFTLLEVAIVLAIVGLLLAGGVNLLSGSADTSKYKQTQNELQEVKDALIAFFLQNGRLPCPDATAPFDGVEDATCTTATTARGWLPHITLGIGGNGDAWGERYRYVVNGEFARSTGVASAVCGSPPTYARCASLDRLRIFDAALITDQQAPVTSTNCPPPSNIYLGDFAAFAIVSTGKNGRATNSGATQPFNESGGCRSNLIGAREVENCDADHQLVSGTPMTDGSSIAFDDMVVWVGDMQLISQLRKAGGCN